MVWLKQQREHMNICITIMHIEVQQSDSMAYKRPGNMHQTPFCNGFVCFVFICLLPFQNVFNCACIRDVLT